MRLKKLIIHGFKSFADRVEISFDGGITGVVGPNGCGKSNIADAVRWVLGEQSAKTLRGAKMEDVIFNGTEKRRRLAFCEVTLVFDNSDKSLPIDFAEVAVTRRVYRSGEGEYKINGTACRLRDIVDLFRDTGVGKDGYSLIGQGRIDEILSQKSEDRRQVFEEAAGIVKYKARKLEAQRRMEHTRDNLSRVEDILSELESRVEPLREQSEAAREYLALRDELKLLDLNVFLLRTERYEARIRELKDAVQALGESILQANEQLEKSGAARDAVQEQLAALEAEAAEKREAVQRLIREVEAGEGAVRVAQERILSATRERDRITAERTAAAEGREGIRNRLVKMRAFIDGETQEVRAEEDRQTVREAELSQSEKRLSDLEARAESEKQQIIQAMNRLGDAASARGSAPCNPRSRSGWAAWRASGRASRRASIHWASRCARRRTGSAANSPDKERSPPGWANCPARSSGSANRRPGCRRKSAPCSPSGSSAIPGSSCFARCSAITRATTIPSSRCSCRRAA